MANVERVAILESTHDLSKVINSLFLMKTATPVNELEQIALLNILCNKIARWC